MMVTIFTTTTTTEPTVTTFNKQKPRAPCVASAQAKPSPAPPPRPDAASPARLSGATKSKSFTKSAVFLNIVQKAVDPPPPFVLNIPEQFFYGFLKKRVNVCRNKIQQNYA